MFRYLSMVLIISMLALPGTSFAETSGALEQRSLVAMDDVALGKRAPHEHSNLSASEKGKRLKTLAANCSRDKCTELDLRYLPIAELAGIGGLTHLKVLYLSYTDVSDISPIARLTNLTDLHIGHTKVVDLTPIADLKNLQLLHIWGTEVKDISALSNLTNLTVLAISDTKVADISPLENLEKLQNLSMNDLYVKDISLLETLPDLRFVEFISKDLKRRNKRTVNRLTRNGVSVVTENIMILC